MLEFFQLNKTWGKILKKKMGSGIMERWDP